MTDTGRISIHAPAWGATAARLQAGMTLDISIHAPAWGATRAVELAFWDIKISIHAPAWGATIFCAVLLIKRTFQSTRPRGARQGLRGCYASVLSFQSTRPRGARQPCCVSVRSSCYFNPRARVGRDTMHTARMTRRQQFQSTRPRGARRRMEAAKMATWKFQSTRPRGARQGDR